MSNAIRLLIVYLGNICRSLMPRAFCVRESAPPHQHSSDYEHVWRLVDAAAAAIVTRFDGTISPIDVGKTA